jgi:hypothetical protein
LSATGLYRRTIRLLGNCPAFNLVDDN